MEISGGIDDALPQVQPDQQVEQPPAREVYSGMMRDEYVKSEGCVMPLRVKTVQRVTLEHLSKARGALLPLPNRPPPILSAYIEK